MVAVVFDYIETLMMLNGVDQAETRWSSDFRGIDDVVT
jgi:hypothetical protein